MYKFKIPLVPESVNGLYKINYAHRVIYLSDEGKAFKYQAKLYIPRTDFTEDDTLSVSVSYHSNWFYKNGKIKRADSPNLDKLMIDTLFEAIGVDDSHLWQWSSQKVQEQDTRFTMVEMRKLDHANQSKEVI